MWVNPCLVNQPTSRKLHNLQKMLLPLCRKSVVIKAQRQQLIYVGAAKEPSKKNFGSSKITIDIATKIYYNIYVR